MHQIVIVGGGAGGLELACKLGRRLGKNKKAEITLVDSHLTHLWKPILHEVAAGTFNAYENELSYLAIAHRNHFTFRIGAMESLDRKKKQVHLSPKYDTKQQEYIPRQSINYDTLVIAVGSETNDFTIKGVKEHCMFLDHREQADAFQQHLLRCVYEAHIQEKPLRSGQLKVAIAGGGATGIELSAELHTAFSQFVAFGLNKISVKRDIKITVIEAQERILSALPEYISELTEHSLNKIDIDVLANQRIVEATEKGFITEQEDFIPAEIKLWAAGIKAPNFLKEIGLETNRINQLIVRPTLQTSYDDNIFAIGDCAACPITNDDHEGRINEQVPPRAQAAHQQASLLTSSIVARLQNQPLKHYRYIDYGSLINLSQYSTVGSMMGNLLGKKLKSIRIQGLIARIIYLSLYKMHHVAIQGVFRVVLLTLANILTQTMKPKMKLH